MLAWRVVYIVRALYACFLLLTALLRLATHKVTTDTVSLRVSIVAASVQLPRALLFTDFWFPACESTTLW